ENFFAIWTNAPLIANATDTGSAELSHQFCTWAKDTLAAGLDPAVSSFPSNVYVFDFFHKLADSAGMLAAQYASDEWDSHPNAAATELVAPQFVHEIFDAAIAYENLVGVQERTSQAPGSFRLKQNYPNPFNPQTTIEYRVKEPCMVSLRIYNLQGREVSEPVHFYQQPGVYKIDFNGENIPAGIYFYEVRMRDYYGVKKMIILK
ncbi:MAG TPA: T9SS type A sorting domain-containing protein, partial [Bacteroidetes bacterium]|nr:T9SS type A sorting domain-containing protein [Bacteroidota bacterium]